jgi:hypothetical protein
MRCSSIECGIKDIGLENTTGFNVVVVHENFAMRQHAKRFLERMAMALEPRDSDWLHYTMWKFHDHAEPSRMKMAADQAAMADAIFIAAYEKEKIPHVLAEWIDLWLPKKAGRPCALVALLARHGENGPLGIYSYLRKVSRKENLAFFVDDRNGGPDDALKLDTFVDSDF